MRLVNIKMSREEKAKVLKKLIKKSFINDIYLFADEVELERKTDWKEYARTGYFTVILRCEKKDKKLSDKSQRFYS